MSDAPPLAPLLLPPAGDRTLAGLRRKVRLRAARWLLGAAPRDPALLRRLRPLQSWLVAALKAQPAAALAAVGAPDVLGPLLVCAEGLAAPEPILRTAGPDLAASMISAGLRPPAPLLWDLPIERLRDPATGRAWRFTPPAKGLLADAGAVHVRLEGGADRSLRALAGAPDAPPPDYVPLTPRLHLALADSNPLAMVEAHPDKAGNAVSLGGRPADDWRAALRDALGLIEAGLPGWRASLPLMVSRVIPVGYEPEMHLSASYREIPGVIYLTLHPDPLTLGEAIVHEAQHNALNLLSLLDPLLENGHSTWTESPVRPDLRPLMGVLLAAHAFVPVAALHARLAAIDHPISRSPAFQRRRGEVLASNRRGLDVLAEQARPTPRGAALLTDLEALDGWARGQVP